MYQHDFFDCRLMQGWLFVNDEEFWQPVQAEALLTSVPLVSHFWLLILLLVTTWTFCHFTATLRVILDRWWSLKVSRETIR